jgi:hypothetical protein
VLRTGEGREIERQSIAAMECDATKTGPLTWMDDGRDFNSLGDHLTDRNVPGSHALPMLNLLRACTSCCNDKALIEKRLTSFSCRTLHTVQGGLPGDIAMMERFALAKMFGRNREAIEISRLQ